MTAMLFNRMGRGIAAALILSALAIGPARGDNGTITLDGVSSNVTVAAWYIGGAGGLAGTNNTLLIKNGGSLTNSNTGTGKVFGLGEAAGNDNNSATVQDANSLWYLTNGILQVGRSGSNNRLTVTNGGEVVAMSTNAEPTVLNPLLVGRDSTNNLLVVSGVGSKVLTPNGGMSVGYWHNSTSNRMIVTDGGTVSNAVGAGVGGGHRAATGSRYNSVTVGGGANTSRWTVATNSLCVGSTQDAVGNTVTIASNGVLQVLGNGVGEGLYVAGPMNSTVNGMRDNALVVTNGGQVTVTRDLCVGSGYASSPYVLTNVGNRVHVTGPGSTMSVGGNLHMSQYYIGISNEVRVADGGLLTVSALTMGDSVGVGRSYDNAVNVTGGRLVMSGDIALVGNQDFLNVTAGGSLTNYRLTIDGHQNTITVSGPGSSATLTANDASYTSININSGNSNTIIVADGGSVSALSGIYVAGNGTTDSGLAGTGNVLRVTGPGSRVATSASIYVGRGPNAKDNRIEVLDGGLLEVAGLKIRQNSEAGGTSGGGNVITNSGGIYQFLTATPLVYTNADGAIYISDGTISFRAITNANVKGNWSGSDIRKMRWSGANAFRLNNATNAATGQDYVFGAGLGATNYVRLDLMNGSLYRGGAVVITNGGTLAVSGGTSTIASNLTLQTGGTLAVDLGASTGACSRLTAQSGVSLGGATLTVSTRHAPERGHGYVIVDKTSSGAIADAFVGGQVNVEFGGRVYLLAVTTTGGDGNDVALRVTQPGTSFTFR